MADPQRERIADGDPDAAALTAALLDSDVKETKRLLQRRPALATYLIEDPDGNVVAPLHIFANAPGHRPRAAEVVTALAAAGADLDDQAVGAWHEETALHWAASNDDVELIDALLDAGADLEHPGSSISQGPPLDSAVGYAQWAAARRLIQRGARFTLWHAAALGMMPEVTGFVEAAPEPDDLSGALWNASRGGQLTAVRYLREHGADLDWPAPWSGETPLDVAGNDEVLAWLTANGAAHGKSPA